MSNLMLLRCFVHITRLVHSPSIKYGVFCSSTGALIPLPWCFPVVFYALFHHHNNVNTQEAAHGNTQWECGLNVKVFHPRGWGRG